MGKAAEPEMLRRRLAGWIACLAADCRGGGSEGKEDIKRV